MRRRWQPSLREAYSWRDQFLRVQHHLDEGQTRSASKSSLRENGATQIDLHQRNAQCTRGVPVRAAANILPLEMKARTQKQSTNTTLCALMIRCDAPE
jgi:hypothetical protein